MSTWASCSGVESSGFELAQSATSSYGGSENAAVSFLWLVPLAGMGLLILSGLNAMRNLGWISASPISADATRVLCLVAALGGLGVAGLFFVRVLAANAEVGFQAITFGGGYWMSVFGFLLSVAGTAFTFAANQPRDGP